MSQSIIIEGENATVRLIDDVVEFTHKEQNIVKYLMSKPYPLQNNASIIIRSWTVERNYNYEYNLRLSVEFVNLPPSMTINNNDLSVTTNSHYFRTFTHLSSSTYTGNTTIVFYSQSYVNRGTEVGKLSYRIQFKNRVKGMLLTSMAYGQQSCLGQDQLEAFESELDADITLKVQSANGESTPIKAMKGLLSLNSPVFRSLLKNSTVTELVIEDQDAEAMAQLITYIYSGRLVMTDFKSAMNIYKAGYTYQVSKVVAFARQHIIHTMRADYLIEALEFATNVSDNALRDGVNQEKYYSWDNADELLNFGDTTSDDAIVRAAITFMSNNVDKNNVFEILELGDARNDDQLINAALDYIVKDKGTPLRKMHGFRELSVDLKLMINEAFVKRTNL